MIKEVDSASNTNVVIQRAMMEPIFTEFADVCLSIAEPAEEEADIEPYDIWRYMQLKICTYSVLSLLNYIL